MPPPMGRAYTMKDAARSKIARVALSDEAEPWQIVSIPEAAELKNIFRTRLSEPIRT